MLDGFSAIEMLIKMADKHMPQFKEMIDDAQDEFDAMYKAAQQQREPDAVTQKRNHCTSSKGTVKNL